MDSNPINKRNSVIEYRPQLDGLRFLAVLFVLIYHYSDWLRAQLLPSLGSFISFFFVLSSYLITTILLTKKDSPSGKMRVTYNFLVRRTLRIFPAYYFYLLLLILLPWAGWDVRAHAGIYFSYLSNFHTYAAQWWDPLTSHLWTLAVEEQFYIVWIWVMLFIPNRHLLKTFYGIVLFSLLFRLLYFFLHPHAGTELIPFIILTPACIDGFGFGAILAYMNYQGKTCGPLLKKIFLVVVPLWLILLRLHVQAALFGFDHIFAGIGSMILIEGAGKGYRNVVGKFLEHRILIYLGNISYGIYLYHLIIPFAFWKIYNALSKYLLHAKKIDLMPLTEFLVLPGVTICLYLLLTVGCAIGSWHFIEKPIISLKRFFNYKASPKRPATVPS